MTTHKTIFWMLAAVMVACGGTTGVSVGGDGGTGDGSNGGSGSGGGSSSGASGSGSGGSSGSSSGASSSSSGSGSGSGSGSSSGSSGGSSSGGTGQMLACGSTSCTVPAQTCCVTPGGGGAMFTYACATGATCPGANDVGLRCMAAADCQSPQVCCLDGNTNVATCAATCNGGNSTQLCDPTAMPTGCPTGTACQAGQVDGLPPTYGSCM